MKLFEKFEKNDEAVSPVIGVILMVAITVILAAVIAAFVFGMTDSMQTQKTVGVQADLSIINDNTDDISLTILGGPDVSSLQSIKWTINQKNATTITGSNIHTGYAANVTNTSDDTDGWYNENHQYTVIATGYFKDGSDQILLKKTF